MNIPDNYWELCRQPPVKDGPICCPVPLQSTGTVGEFVAGVRYKATQLPAVLHPTVPAVGALVFDLIDTWSGRVVGGFTYHPAQPVGWGALAAPASGVTGVHPGEALEAPRAPPGLPTWHTGGRFTALGSGRVEARPRQPRPAPGRPYLLDLSFPD